MHVLSERSYISLRHGLSDVSETSLFSKKLRHGQFLGSYLTEQFRLVMLQRIRYDK